MQLTCVTIDCGDPERLATFWSGALGWTDVVVAPDGSGAECRSPAEDAVYLEFVRVPEDKVVKNRVHLGCSAGSLADVDGELARLAGLGATVAWEEQFPPAIATAYRNVVLRDPEGNEFCLGGGAFPA